MSGGAFEVIPVAMKANNKPAGESEMLKDGPQCSVDEQTVHIDCTFYLGSGPRTKKIMKSEFQAIT